MNQILSTKINQNRKKTSEPLEMRKIIIIFSCLITIFGLFILGIKGFVIIKGKNKQNDISKNRLNKPSISVERVESICTLEVFYDEGLEKITYWWNDGDVIVKNMNGSTTPFITQIVIPQEDNKILHIRAVGIDGSINEETKDFAENSNPNNLPEISWFYEEGKMRIVAKSSKGIAKLSYQWEDHDEVVVNSTEENQQELTVSIDARRGTNKITIVATDNENNTQTKETTIIGIFEPEFNIRIENDNILKISIKHDKGFKKAIIRINDQEEIYDENYPGYRKEVTELTSTVEVPSGSLDVELRVYTLEEPDKEYTRTGHADIP